MRRMKERFEEKAYDVIVVGGGMSGLCAATQAQESLNATGGGSVVVFEKYGTIGGE